MSVLVIGLLARKGTLAALVSHAARPINVRKNGKNRTDRQRDRRTDGRTDGRTPDKYTFRHGYGQLNNDLHEAYVVAGVGLPVLKNVEDNWSLDVLLVAQ